MRRPLLALLIMFAFLATAVAAPAHGASMTAGERAAMSGPMAMHDAHAAACPKPDTCKTDRLLCAFVCAGVAVWLPPLEAASALVPHAGVPAGQGETILHGLGPQRAERPPDHGLI